VTVVVFAPNSVPPAENKISKDNSWDVRIIDYMPTLIYYFDEDGQFNFQKGSAALHASAQVYSKRVDSAYDTVYASMQGINVRQHGSEDSPGRD
jgi:hypothetical protein